MRKEHFLILTLLITGTLLDLRPPLHFSVPNNWALTNEEITKSRGNRVRENLQTITFYNNAELILDGADFFRVLYNDLEKTTKGDFIYATFFEEDVRVMFMPDPNNIQNSRNTTIYNMVSRAIKRGVTVRFLVNNNLLQFYNAVPFCVQLNLLCGYVCCGVDARHHNWIGGNLHTKMWLVKTGSDTIVYNGGMDVAGGRWDTQKHDNSKERQMDYDFLGHTAVHDSVMRLRGPAIVDYVRHFHQSWNDPYPAVFPMFSLPKYEYQEPPFINFPQNGLQIQILRTVGCKGAKQGFYQNFAPLGETSGMAAIIKMIRNTKEFLYMEDQFFNFNEILKEVKEILPKIKAVVILTNNQNAPNLMSNERWYFQYKSLIQLMEDPILSNKVHIFNLLRDTNPKLHIYVHSKLFIADDEYMITGSFGIERSGLTNDLEMGLGIYDPNGNFVKESRKKIWAEHLILNENDPILNDPIMAIAEWDKQGKEGNKRVRHYFPPNMSKTLLSDMFYQVYEVDGRCE